MKHLVVVMQEKLERESPRDIRRYIKNIVVISKILLGKKTCIYNFDSSYKVKKLFLFYFEYIK